MFSGIEREFMDMIKQTLRLERKNADCQAKRWAKKETGLSICNASLIDKKKGRFTRPLRLKC